MKNKIRIGCASAFWGDTTTSASQLVNHGDIDYLVFDYLAEMTMSILARAKSKNNNLGYAIDFIHHIGPLLNIIKEKNIKVISNAGGLNSYSCRDALNKILKDQNIDLKIAIIDGDNVLDKKNYLKSISINELDTNEQLPEKPLSINAYLGAPGVKNALELEADIVIIGRCVDSAVVLGPLMYEFDWKDNDYNLLASGSLAGHIIECGAQCTGGNFTDWESVRNFENMGFPIIEVLQNGDFFVTKPKNTGGLVNRGTVAEQFLYEIGDPGAYLLPDVICDFTKVNIKEIEPNLVFVSGALGLPPTHTYKVSATYEDGYKIIATIVIGGPKSVEKANVIGESIIKKTSMIFKQEGFQNYTNTKVDILGSEAMYKSNHYVNTREVVLRIAATHKEKAALVIMSKEIAQAATGMAPGVMNYLGGRPSVSPCIKLFSFLMDKKLVDVSVNIDDKLTTVDIDDNNKTRPIKGATKLALDSRNIDDSYKKVELIDLAYVRSGDKGDHANIGVIAREPEFLRYIKKSLTIEVLKKHFSHVLKGSIECWEVPGIYGLNFLLKHSLGGGGMASLNIDPQGKAYAQQIIDLEISVPESIYNQIKKNKKLI
tara:strand:+ start:3325 stop:5124 length:1800 start_codon:yes stop_codon:yes gene_type:complete